MLGTFKHTGWRYSSRQLCNCVIGGVDVAHRIRMLARRSSDHLAARLLIVLTSPHSYRSPVDRVTGLSAPAPAKRAGAQHFVRWPITSRRVIIPIDANEGKADAQSSTRLGRS
jgi:hypothetical protein